MTQFLSEGNPQHEDKPMPGNGQPLQHRRATDRIDPVWTRVCAEAQDAAQREPQFSGFLFSSILNHTSLEQAIAYRIAEALDHSDIRSTLIRQAFEDMIKDDKTVCEAIRADVVAVFDRDPACDRYLDPVLYFKGFQALQAHRLAHWLWGNGRRDFALYLQSRSSRCFTVDIHPEARIGRGVFLDHAHAIVIGQTAVVEDEVSILHDVTLGGTGKTHGDRHPKIRRGVLIGAGAKILGNIEVGCCTRIAAGSVVLTDVPPNVTVAGVPARIMGEAGCSEPALSMNQTLASKGDDD